MSNLLEAHRRLVKACSERSWRDDPEDPNRPETVQAMQIALHLPKQEPPARTEVLHAAARAVGSIPLMPGGLLVVEAVLVPGLVPIDFGWHCQRALRMPRTRERAEHYRSRHRLATPCPAPAPVPHPFP